MTGCCRWRRVAAIAASTSRRRMPATGRRSSSSSILGAIVVWRAILVEILFAPPLWVHVVLWTPVILGGAILLLRPFKAGLIALQYRHRALGGPAA